MRKRRSNAEKKEIYIKYKDSEGHITKRTIAISRIDGSEYIHAYCNLRREYRTFRFDGIIEAVDTKTGEVLNPLTLRPEMNNSYTSFRRKPSQIKNTTKRYKKRTTTAILAILLGGMGVHRFYLGQRRGIFYLLFCWTFLPLAIAIAEAIYFIIISDDEWDKKYNTWVFDADYAEDSNRQQEEYEELAQNISDSNGGIVNSGNFLTRYTNIPVFSLENNLRIIEVYKDKVVLTGKGFVNKLSGGVKGSKTIPFESITAIQFKEPGLTTGYLQFSVSGSREARPGVSNAVYDENTFPFKKDTEKVLKIKTYIESQKTNNKKGFSHTSAADELSKLAELKNRGMLSDDEFSMAKMKILNR